MTLFLMLALAIGPAYDLDHRLTDGGAPVHEIETNSVGRVTVVVSRPRGSLQPRRGNARTFSGGRKAPAARVQERANCVASMRSTCSCRFSSSRVSASV